MDTPSNKVAELQVGPRLKGLTLERLNELVRLTREAPSTLCKKLLDAVFSLENDPAAILAGGKVIPPVVTVTPVEEKPTVDLSGLATSAQVETLGTSLQTLMEKPVDLAPVLNKIDGIEVKPVVNLNPLLDEIRTVTAKIEELPKFEKTDLESLIEELEALRNKLGSLPAVFEAVAKIQTDLGKVTAGLDVLNKNLTPVPEAMAKIQADLGKLDITPVATGLDVISKNVGRLANSIDDDHAERAKSAQEKAKADKVILIDVLKETVKGLVLAPTPEPPWRRNGILVAIGVCLVLSAIAAFRQVPAPVTSTSVDLAPIQAELRAVRQAVEARPDLGHKVAELTQRVDVQDKAFVAVMDRLKPLKK